MNGILVSSLGKLIWKDKEYRCAIGKSGVRKNKIEGDGATPDGCFRLRKVLFRKDRIADIETRLPKTELRPTDGWCDDPKDRNYNRLVTLPYPASAESLWREDNLYDVIAVLGYNDEPVVQGKGARFSCTLQAKIIPLLWDVSRLHFRIYWKF